MKYLAIKFTCWCFTDT